MYACFVGNNRIILGISAVWPWKNDRVPRTEDVSLKTLTFPSILVTTRAEHYTAALGYQNVRLEPTTARACVDLRQPIIWQRNVCRYCSGGLWYIPIIEMFFDRKFHIMIGEYHSLLVQIISVSNNVTEHYYYYILLHHYYVLLHYYYYCYYYTTTTYYY